MRNSRRVFDRFTKYEEGLAMAFFALTSILVFVGALTPGHGVTATATDAAGNTSEFSPCVVVSSPNEPAAGPVASAGLLGSGRQAPAGVRRERIAGR